MDFIESENLKNVFWLIKPHPSRGHYHEIGIIEELMKKDEEIRQSVDEIKKRLV